MVTASRPRQNRAAGPGGAMVAVLIGPYEIGRQPFGLAEPAAWLAEAGFTVRCVDLAREPLRAETLAGAALVGCYLPMHTATRIALAVVPRIRALAPGAHLCAYGLYAPVNEPVLRAAGFASVLGGEVEARLLALACALRDGAAPVQAHAEIALERIAFRVPLRAALPALAEYPRLRLPGGAERMVAFAETSRGCKHRCRHCPVVPVYDGRFRVVPVEVVMADIGAQIEAGAEHVSFGDPDFLNGPSHALRVVRALAAEHPGVSFDATVKIEHILRHRALLPELARCGCLFLTSAAEALDDRILERLAKGHRAADLGRAAGLLAAAGIRLAPTFVAFTPWTSIEGYLGLLATLVELGLVNAVAPVQLAIRLLIPAGSRLLELPEIRALAGDFDAHALGHPWHHPNPAVDDLQRHVEALAAAGEQGPRAATFAAIWEAAHRAARRPPPALPADLGAEIPAHGEPWYCCAEPTTTQLAAHR